jgi:hypothetical protein
VEVAQAQIDNHPHDVSPELETRGPEPPRAKGLPYHGV